MNDTVRFVLDGEIVEVSCPDPTRTVLQYLREELVRCGTKEGCAEGDCGACTVVLGELNDDQSGVDHKAVNACIQLLPTLQGKELITVESLAADPAQPHPVQQAMIDCHAAQCGFCTPGFVMSLYAQYQTGQQLSRAEIDTVLSGNLCRCTGYRPIVDAAQRMYDYPLEQGGQDNLALLKSIQTDATVHIEHGASRFFAPLTVAELADLVEQYPQATLLAGGTDVGLWITKQYRQLDCIIYLGRVAELSRIERDEGELVIGAAATLSQALTPLLAHYPALTELFIRFASLPIRNAATLGGNIANGSPIGDAMPALIATGAKLQLRRGATTREMALEDFYLDYQQTALQPGEFVEKIILPALDDGQQLAAYKVSKRFDQDISAVCGGFCIKLAADDGRIEQVRIAFGGLATTPKRAALCEAALLGRVWNVTTLADAMQALKRDFDPISDMRASRDYRQQTAANLLRRFYLESTGHPGPTNVYSYGRAPAGTQG